MIALPSDATQAELEDLCETYSARLDQWLRAGDRPRYLYDGTIGSLCDAFERHPRSRIHQIADNTAASYLDSLKVIRASIPRRAVRAIAPIDVKEWYELWRAPKPQADKNAPLGPERVKRAHDAVATLRMILRFGHSLGHKECGELCDGLARLQFERSPRREGAMTIDHARAFIRTSLARNDSRGLYMAIGVATQFETMLRQKDVIGEWGREEGSTFEVWTGLYTWENIPGGILRLRTSKTKTEIVHDLTRLDLLWPLIQRVPQADRTGAIIKAYGEPIRTRSYRKWYREIADEAGIPRHVWNMDARAGGVTEALEAGAEITDVQRAATHSSPSMTSRYDRKSEAAVASVAAARKRSRRP